MSICPGFLLSGACVRTLCLGHISCHCWFFHPYLLFLTFAIDLACAVRMQASPPPRGGATTVSVAETALFDFFARVLINETGRINLQDLVKSSAAADGALPANVAKKS